MGRTARVVVAVTTAAGLLTACTADPPPERNAAPTLTSFGDGYYPLDGNTGIDVDRYRIQVAYAFDTGRLTGTTTLTIRATKRLASFSLDFLLPVSDVTLSTGAAAYSQESEHELLITPGSPIAAGTRFRATVTYAGVPAEATYLGTSNWHADKYEVVTIDEPHMAPWWFPANDHPSDKARMDVSVTVPTGNTVIGNGALVSRQTSQDGTTFRWRAAEPMATYLAFFAAGRFTVTRGVTADGIPWVDAVSQRGTDREQAQSARLLAHTPKYLSWLVSRLGDYPFGQTGGVVSSLGVGFSLETQTRPVYGDHIPRGYHQLLVHELAHQWFGDSVSLTRWQDVWLNEGFATFVAWVYDEEHGGRSAQDLLVGLYGGAGHIDWALPIGTPDPDDLFNEAVYARGGMTLQALRNRIGDKALWTVLRTWLREHRYANATADEFIALAERISGEDLDGFFEAWLDTPERPERTADNGL